MEREPGHAPAAAVRPAPAAPAPAAAVPPPPFNYVEAHAATYEDANTNRNAAIAAHVTALLAINPHLTDRELLSDHNLAANIPVVNPDFIEGDPKPLENFNPATDKLVVTNEPLPRVLVVDNHEELFFEKAHVPVASSRAFDTQLERVSHPENDGLYHYAHDDIATLTPVVAEVPEGATLVPHRDTRVNSANALISYWERGEAVVAVANHDEPNGFAYYTVPFATLEHAAPAPAAAVPPPPAPAPAAAVPLPPFNHDEAAVADPLRRNAARNEAVSNYVTALQHTHPDITYRELSNDHNLMAAIPTLTPLEILLAQNYTGSVHLLDAKIFDAHAAPGEATFDPTTNRLVKYNIGDTEFVTILPKDFGIVSEVNSADPQATNEILRQQAGSYFLGKLHDNPAITQAELVADIQLTNNIPAVNPEFLPKNTKNINEFDPNTDKLVLVNEDPQRIVVVAKDEKIPVELAHAPIRNSRDFNAQYERSRRLLDDGLYSSRYDTLNALIPTVDAVPWLGADLIKHDLDGVNVGMYLSSCWRRNMAVVAVANHDEPNGFSYYTVPFTSLYSNAVPPAAPAHPAAAAVPPPPAHPAPVPPPPPAPEPAHPVLPVFNYVEDPAATPEQRITAKQTAVRTYIANLQHTHPDITYGELVNNPNLMAAIPAASPFEVNIALSNARLDHFAEQKIFGDGTPRALGVFHPAWEKLVKYTVDGHEKLAVLPKNLKLESEVDNSRDPKTHNDVLSSQVAYYVQTHNLSQEQILADHALLAKIPSLPPTLLDGINTSKDFEHFNPKDKMLIRVESEPEEIVCVSKNLLPILSAHLPLENSHEFNEQYMALSALSALRPIAGGFYSLNHNQIEHLVVTLPAVPLGANKIEHTDGRSSPFMLLNTHWLDGEAVVAVANHAEPNGYDYYTIGFNQLYAPAVPPPAHPAGGAAIHISSLDPEMALIFAENHSNVDESVKTQHDLHNLIATKANLHYVFDPESNKHYLIEVNPKDPLANMEDNNVYEIPANLASNFAGTSVALVEPLYPSSLTSTKYNESIKPAADKLISEMSQYLADETKSSPSVEVSSTQEGLDMLSYLNSKIEEIKHSYNDAYDWRTQAGNDREVSRQLDSLEHLANSLKLLLISSDEVSGFESDASKENAINYLNHYVSSTSRLSGVEVPTSKVSESQPAVSVEEESQPQPVQSKEVVVLNDTAHKIVSGTIQPKKAEDADTIKQFVSFTKEGYQGISSFEHEGKVYLLATSKDDSTPMALEVTTEQMEEVLSSMQPNIPQAPATEAPQELPEDYNPLETIVRALPPADEPIPQPPQEGQEGMMGAEGDMLGAFGGEYNGMTGDMPGTPGYQMNNYGMETGGAAQGMIPGDTDSDSDQLTPDENYQGGASYDETPADYQSAPVEETPQQASAPTEEAKASAPTPKAPAPEGNKLEKFMTPPKAPKTTKVEEHKKPSTPTAAKKPGAKPSMKDLMAAHEMANPRANTPTSKEPKKVDTKEGK